MIRQSCSKFQKCRYISSAHVSLIRRCFARRNKVDWLQLKHCSSFRWTFLPIEQREQQQWRRTSTLKHYATERHAPFVSMYTARALRFLSTGGFDNGTRHKHDKNESDGENQPITIGKAESSTRNPMNYHTTSSKGNVTVEIPEGENAKMSTTTDILAKTTTTTVATNDPYWMERFIPQSYRPYAYLARLDKPIGTMLLVGGLCFPFCLLLIPH